jgi:hypothetical protein
VVISFSLFVWPTFSQPLFESRRRREEACSLLCFAAPTSVCTLHVSQVAFNRATRYRVRVPRPGATHEAHVHVTHACGREQRWRHRLDRLVVGPLCNKPSYSYLCVSCNVQTFLSPLHLNAYLSLSRRVARVRVNPPPLFQLLYATTPRPSGAACASSRNAKPKRERWAPRTYASSRASCTGTPAPPAT